MASNGNALSRFGFGGDTPFYRDERFLRLVAQIFSAIVVLGIIYWTISNFLSAAEQRGMDVRTYNWLRESAGFPIGESVIPYDPSDSFAYAFWIGILNTIKVAFAGVILATILGVIVGLGRLSSNWMISRISQAFVEFHRNIPLLVLLLLWYRGFFISRLPSVAESIEIFGVMYLNQRGVYMIWPQLNPGNTVFVVLLALSVILSITAYIVLQRIQVQTGRNTYFVIIAIIIFVGLPLIGWFIAPETPLRFDRPVLDRFNFQGGLTLSPEFGALLVALVTYTAGFIAEIVRAGIQAVSRGQVEAATAVGLSYFSRLRLVVIPQAMRVIIPPLISQYLNLVKNSSLAFFIGYPDMFAIGRIITNQAGRAVPVIVMVMVVYLFFSLVTSIILNIYNRRIQFVEH